MTCWITAAAMLSATVSCLAPLPPPTRQVDQDARQAEWGLSVPAIAGHRPRGGLMQFAVEHPLQMRASLTTLGQLLRFADGREYGVSSSSAPTSSPASARSGAPPPPPPSKVTASADKRATGKVVHADSSPCVSCRVSGAVGSGMLRARTNEVECDARGEFELHWTADTSTPVTKIFIDGHHSVPVDLTDGDHVVIRLD